MNKVPEHFIVKRDNNNPLWDKFIKWLNYEYSCDWIGKVFNYYGHHIGAGVNGTNCYDKINTFSGNPILLSLEKWDSIVNGFTVPRKWCISRNLHLDDNDVVTNYINKRFGTYFIKSQFRGGFYLIDENTRKVTHSSNRDKKDYEEITFEQFKKHILKYQDMDIIGYKLKPSCLQYKSVAFEIVYKTSGTSSLYLSGDADFLKIANDPDPGSISALKSAGVLDLWFEPVYDYGYKVGDWVWSKQDAIMGTDLYNRGANPFEILAINEQGFVYDLGSVEGNTDFNNGNRSCTYSMCNIDRIATAEEIMAVTLSLPKINGYEGVLRANKTEVKYGCAYMSISKLRSIYNCETLSNNRNVKSITLDSNVTITMKQIKEILDFVDKK